MASKVEEDIEGFIRWLYDCGIVPFLSRPRIALLVAAVREEERELCVAIMNAERVEADETQHPSDYAYNGAIDDCIEAIRRG